MDYLKCKISGRETIVSRKQADSLRNNGEEIILVSQLSKRASYAYSLIVEEFDCISEAAISAYEVAVKRGQYQNVLTPVDCLNSITREFSELILSTKIPNEKYLTKRLLEFADGFNGTEEEFKTYIQNKYVELYTANVKDSLSDEMADLILTVLSVATHLKIDISSAIARKHRFNSLR